MARSAFEMAVLSGCNPHAGAKFTDGTFPYNYWVSPNGYDGVGNGSPENPFDTVGRAIKESRDGRGDRILVTAGSYAETLDIGSGSSTYGQNGSYAKKNLQIIGDDSLYNGAVQIIGDGSTATAALRVKAGYLRGFVLKNVELDTNGVAVPALHLVTSNTASGSQSNTDLRFVIENVAVRSDDPDVGIMLEGASSGNFRGCLIQGPQIGVAFTGSENNNPVDLDFEDMQWRDCVTADWATVANAGNTAGRTTIAARNLTNVNFWRSRHMDIGGTPVTNYINTQGTMVNVGSFMAYFARNVGDGTAMELAANVVVIGEDGNSAVNIIGT